MLLDNLYFKDQEHGIARLMVLYYIKYFIIFLKSIVFLFVKYSCKFKPEKGYEWCLLIKM